MLKFVAPLVVLAVLACGCVGRTKVKPNCSKIRKLAECEKTHGCTPLRTTSPKGWSWACAEKK